MDQFGGPRDHWQHVTGPRGDGADWAGSTVECAAELRDGTFDFLHLHSRYVIQASDGLLAAQRVLPLLGDIASKAREDRHRDRLPPQLAAPMLRFLLSAPLVDREIYVVEFRAHLRDRD